MCVTVKNIQFTMESNGFYVTLPSNASLDFHPNNTLTKYTVQLPRTLYLKPDFVVGLAEIQYPLSWLTVPESSCSIIDFTQGVTITAIQFPNAHYESVIELVRVINKNLVTFFEIYELPKRTLMLVYDDLTDKVTLKGRVGYGLFLNDELRAIFGFDSTQDLYRRQPKGPFVDDQSGEEFNVEALYKSDINRGFHALYVYCNICEPQIVGDVYAPLLRTVAIKGKRHDHVTITYNQPHYIPIGTREISEIEIDIREDTGRKVSFTAGKVVCKLHFKKNEAIHS